MGITIVLSTVTRSKSLDSHETQPPPASARPLSRQFALAEVRPEYLPDKTSKG